MSWILSLGAGREQIPLIKAIHHEGHKVAAVDMRHDAEGVDLCDAFCPVSNRDADAVTEYARWVGVEGVMCAASEVPDVMAIVAHRLGLPGVSVATGMTIKDKLRQKRTLMTAGVPCTQLVVTHKLGDRIVCKPRESSGSRNVRLMQGPRCEDYTAPEGTMWEFYEEGPQISTETLIWDGMSCMPAFADRHYDGFAHEIGVSMPSRFNELYGTFEQLSVRAAHALGIVRGTIKCDIVLTASGPKIIECTCRLSGGPLCLLVEQSLGFNYFREAVKIAVGKEPDWEHMMGRTPKKASLDLLGNATDWHDAEKFIVPLPCSPSHDTNLPLADK